MKDLSAPFQTDRLFFRMLREPDLDVIHRQFSDPEMCRYLSDGPLTREQAMEIIEQFQNPNQDNFIRYAMFSRTTGEFVGTCGYHRLDSEKRQVELGYDIWKASWRNGYASEALEPLLEISFGNPSVDHVYVLIHKDNVASIATAARAGFTRCEPCRPLDEPEQVCMKLTRIEWESRETRKQLERDGAARHGI